MSWPLFWKILRDLRWPLLGTIFLLMLFEGIWTKITDRITNELIPAIIKKIPAKELFAILFEGSGKFLQVVLGGETVDIAKTGDFLSIGFIHPLPQTILLIWAVGRAAAALAGEIERGTMELLVAQPIARWRIVTTHFCVDLVILPALALAMWCGLFIGVKVVPLSNADLMNYWKGAALAACLAFALSGLTMAISSLGRSRWRVLAWTIGLVLIISLWNTFGQLWDAITPYRPWSFLYYYQPQMAILHDQWTLPVGAFHVSMPGVLLGLGFLGYGFALWHFSLRDLPAPL